MKPRGVILPFPTSSRRELPRDCHVSISSTDGLNAHAGPRRRARSVRFFQNLQGQVFRGHEFLRSPEIVACGARSSR